MLVPFPYWLHWFMIAHQCLVTCSLQDWCCECCIWICLRRVWKYQGHCICVSGSFISQMCDFVKLVCWGMFLWLCCLLCSLPNVDMLFLFFQFRFGPRESKKAMMYSDVGRLNCNVSYTTFATPIRGQVCKRLYPCIFFCLVFLFEVAFNIWNLTKLGFRPQRV